MLSWTGVVHVPDGEGFIPLVILIGVGRVRRMPAEDQVSVRVVLYM